MNGFKNLKIHKRIVLKMLIFSDAFVQENVAYGFRPTSNRTKVSTIVLT